MLRLFALAAALTVPLVAGCGATSVTHLGSQPHRDHRVIAIVGDASCDATAAQRAQTLGIVELAAGQAAAQRGTLLFDRLGRNALAAMTFPVQHEFVPSDDVPEGNSALEAEDLQRQQAQVRKAARRLLQRPTRRCGTDLAGGFVAIAR